MVDLLGPPRTWVSSRDSTAQNVPQLAHFFSGAINGHYTCSQPDCGDGVDLVPRPQTDHRRGWANLRSSPRRLRQSVRISAGHRSARVRLPRSLGEPFP